MLLYLPSWRGLVTTLQERFSVNPSATCLVRYARQNASTFACFGRGANPLSVLPRKDFSVISGVAVFRPRRMMNTCKCLVQGFRMIMQRKTIDRWEGSLSGLPSWNKRPGFPFGSACSIWPSSSQCPQLVNARRGRGASGGVAAPGGRSFSASGAWATRGASSPATSSGPCGWMPRPTRIGTTSGS